MQDNAFALFVDVMGVQERLIGTSPSSQKMNECRKLFERFHSDLEETIGHDINLLTAHETLGTPLFVAQFSDSAYVVADGFTTVLAIGLVMMRRSLRHAYALRGGIGFGNFSHETSGSSTGRDGQVWSTSSFFGSAVVTAYQAERSPSLGFRLFVHPQIADNDDNDVLRHGTTLLPVDEVSEHSEREVRLWSAGEAVAAAMHLHHLSETHELTPRARQHYDGTIRAYRHFEGIKADLPFHPGDALWLFSAR